MIDNAYLEIFIAALRRHHHVERFESGLSGSEVADVERHFMFAFPPDLRMVLQYALPIGKGFPNWRSGPEEQLLFQLNGPLEGILFDVETNAVWPIEWGPMPADRDGRSRKVSDLVGNAPRLVPIYFHRYIPAGAERSR
jgi:hypothetical protein